MAADNLKTRVTADTSDFKKGMREAKTALNDFKKQGEGALSGIENLLGGTSGALGEVARNIKNASTLFTQMGRDGSGALSNLSAGARLLGGALAGLGLTAVIAGFKELNRSAELFRSTIEGTNLELQTKAYTDAFRMAMEDQLGNGASIASTGRWVKEAGTKIGSTVGNMAIAAIASIKPFENPATGLVRLTENLQNVIDAAKNADTAGRASAQYQGQLNRAIEERLKKTNEWKELQYQIAANERVAADTEAEKEERETAILNARRYQERLFEEQISSAKEIYKWTALIGEETGNSKIETETLVALEGNIIDLQKLREEKGRALDKLANRVAKAAENGASAAKSHASSAKETQQATELTLAAATALVEKERALKAIQDQNNAMKAAARFRMDGALPGMETPGNLQASANALTVPALIKPVVDTEQAQQAVIELTSIVESGVVGMSEALGELIGNLINGEAAWQNFAQAGIGVVADMLSTVGKAFITEGIGVEAAKLALKTGNGIAAIAAGSAMVALAAAMKTTMSNAAANWSGGGGAAVASSSYSSGSLSAGSVAQTVNVRVTGTLTGEGSKLKAVLNNEDTRLATTT